MRRINTRTARLISVLVLVTFVLSFLVVASAAWAATGTITGSVVNIRSGPGTNYTKVGAITKGAQVEVIKQAGDWCEIRFAGNKTGWVSSSLISVKATSQSQPVVSTTSSSTVSATGSGTTTVEVTGTTVNLRQGPGTSYKVVGKVSKGTVLTVVDKSGDWYKITGQGIPVGYISSSLVKIRNNVATTGSSSTQGSVAQGTQNKAALVTGQVVNLRSGPGTSYSKVGQLVKGDTVQVLKSSSDWYLVKTESGAQGWVAGWLVQVVTSGSTPNMNQNTNQTADPPSNSASGGTTPNAPSNSQEPEASLPSRGSERYEPQPEPEPSPPETVPVVEGELTGITEIVAGNIQIVTVSLSVGTAYETKSESGHFVLTLKGIRKNSVGDVIGLDGKGATQVQVEERMEQYPITLLTFATIGKPVFGVTPSQGGKELKVFIKADLSARRTGQVRVVLDPGHGGKDPGAIGPAGTQEKDINLPIALEVGRILSLDGIDVAYTRTADVYLSLAERSQVANNADADLFVSIHCNGSTSPDKQGISTYYYAPADNQVLYSQEGDRRLLASSIQKALLSELARGDMGVRQGNFAVLRETVIPCALVETLFITNPEEETLLAQTSIQLRAAAAIAQGIKDYLVSIGRK